MSIRPLPKDAIDKIRSSSAVTSLNDVVCGLLKNSLDAESSKVNLNLDFALGNCSIEDDGIGIEPREFEEGGGLGKLHHTSKLPRNPNAHGRHGNFIASVATFSLLNISSCHYRHDTHSALTIHNGNVLVRSIPARPGQRLVTFVHGTRISVRNLFGCMPVRVKLRAILFSDRAKIDREWDAVVKEMAALLLAWPCDVSVFVREANTHREARIRGTSTDLTGRTSSLFTQAGLAEREDRGSWVPASASSRRVKIKGAISTTPVATRRSQIICLGILPVQNSFGTNVLYEEVNNMFKSSTFGVVNGNDMDRIQDKAKKGVEKWPMFFLQVHILGANQSLTMDDVLGDSRHNLQAIVELLKIICYGFLKKHWMQPRHLQKPGMKASGLRCADQPHSLLEPKAARTRLPPRALAASADAPAAGSAYIPSDPWHRTKVGIPVPLKSAIKNHKADQPTEHKPAPVDVHARLVGEDGMLLRKPFDDVDEATCASRIEVGKGPSEPTESQATMATEPSVMMAQPTVQRTDHEAQTPQPLGKHPKPQPQQWLQDILDGWENPVFETTERPIPALPQSPVPVDRSVEVRGDGHKSRFFSHPNDFVEFEAISMDLSGRLSRRALGEAKVIGQVDRKFILLQLPLRTTTEDAASEPSSALVMLDQHAADERCRLEELMSQYFLQTSRGLEAVTEPLERRIVFEMSAREKDLFRRCHAHFQTWGIALEYSTGKDAETEGGDVAVVAVLRLPPSISERCQSDPRLIIELIREEIWKCEDVGAPLRPAYEPGRSWVSCFHSCPDGILELLHSRSCRSAIMFNDELPLDDCRRLVDRLSRCAFPFQCAHGRPSMAPLVDIGSGTGRLGSWSEGLSRRRVVHWKKWLDG